MVFEGEHIIVAKLLSGELVIGTESLDRKTIDKAVGLMIAPSPNNPNALMFLLYPLDFFNTKNDTIKISVDKTYFIIEPPYNLVEMYFNFFSNMPNSMQGQYSNFN
jgi:hypothetical protein